MKKLATRRKTEVKIVVPKKHTRHPRRKPKNNPEAAFDATNYLLQDYPDL